MRKKLQVAVSVHLFCLLTGYGSLECDVESFMHRAPTPWRHSQNVPGRVNTRLYLDGKLRTPFSGDPHPPEEWKPCLTFNHITWLILVSEKLGIITGRCKSYELDPVLWLIMSFVTLFRPRQESSMLAAAFYIFRRKAKWKWLLNSPSASHVCS